MVNAIDILNLLNEWEERLKDESYPSAYKDALNDCIYELNSLSVSYQEDVLKETNLLQRPE